MSINSRQKSTLLTFDQHNRCINCSFLIPKNLRRHALEEANKTMIVILRSWITPTQLSPESIICTKCFELLQNKSNTMSEGSALPLPAFGHRRVCIPCGHSILRATRTYPVHPNRQERHILLKFVPLHLISDIERVCAACWRAASRQLQRQQQHNTNRSTLTDVDSKDVSIPEPPPLPLPSPKSVQEVLPKVISSLYRRAANTAGHCIFANCFESERLIVPSDIKDIVLFDHKFYIPPAARVCRHHLDHGPWNELTSQLNDFTGKQFDSMMNMMERVANSTTDFSNVRRMPPHLCQYWLGMSSDKFYDLLNGIPDLAKHVPNAAMALCVFIVKLRTGDSNERLTNLFNKPRSTLERWMSKVKKCLFNESVPQDMFNLKECIVVKKNQRR